MFFLKECYNNSILCFTGGMNEKTDDYLFASCTFWLCCANKPST